MKRDPVKASVMATRIIPNVASDMAQELGLLPGEKSLAIITADCDDVTYTALDEATKKAVCRVAYAKSFYAGAANANTALAGEVIGILAAPNPAEARAALEACVDVIENQAYFVSANADDSVVYYAHCIPRTGSYLSEGAGINEGEALAYLIAPPLEAMYGSEGRRRAHVRALRAPFRDQLRRRSADRQPVRLQIRLRRLCRRCGAGGRPAPYLNGMIDFGRRRRRP